MKSRIFATVKSRCIRWFSLFFRLHPFRYRRVEMDAELQKVLAFIRDGAFGDARVFAPLLDTLTSGGDFYLISADFSAYLKAKESADQVFKDKQKWARHSIYCTAGMGKFSSDRSIQEYAEQIWNIKRCPIP